MRKTNNIGYQDTPMHQLRSVFRDTRHEILDNRPVYAVEMPKVQKHPNTIDQLVWDTDGKGLSRDLGKEVEVTGNIG